MPIVADIPQVKSRNTTEEAYVWNCTKFMRNSTSSGGAYIVINDTVFGINSSVPSIAYMLPMESNKRFIKLGIEFDKQLEQKYIYFEHIGKELVKKKFNDITSTFLDYNLEKFSFELTYEGGMFFTLKKGEYSFYIQYFFDNELGDNEEVLLSIFQGETKLPSYDGKLIEIVYKVENILSSQIVGLV